MKPFLALIVAALALAPGVSADELSGTVIETMNSGGYTYLLIQTAAGEKKWAAVAQANIKKGDSAAVINSTDMKDFESPTLKRRFDAIAFGMLRDGEKAGAHAGMSHGGRAAPMGPITVAKAAGPDGRTVAEVYAKMKELKGKEVVVRGKVVKMNANILDRNWAHLRDGSGKAKDGSDDLTVMLKDTADVGQVVTVRGKVLIDKDLGGRYKFPVVLEDAVLVK